MFTETETKRLLRTALRIPTREFSDHALIGRYEGPDPDFIVEERVVLDFPVEPIMDSLLSFPEFEPNRTAVIMRRY